MFYAFKLQTLLSGAVVQRKLAIQQTLLYGFWTAGLIFHSNCMALSAATNTALVKRS